MGNFTALFYKVSFLKLYLYFTLFYNFVNKKVKVETFSARQ
nr:MAG TPA: hypothetical protein [Caudoviricetes sp.]